MASAARCGSFYWQYRNSALTDSDELLVEKQYRFRNPPEPVAAALGRVGLDVANLANNHSLDYGYSGLEDTLNALNAQQIQTIGAGENNRQARQPAIFAKDNTRIGFLAYSNTFPEEFWSGKNRPGTAFGHAHHIQEDIAALKADGVNIVIVSFHWGREGTTELRPYQPLLAHTAIDAGADVVIGHHPHILQGIERYKNGLIFYSLGNFTFGSYSQRARDSALVQLVFLDGQFHKAELIPIDVYNSRVLFQPVPLTGSEARRVLAEWQQLSAPEGLVWQQEGDRAVLTFP